MAGFCLLLLLAALPFSLVAAFSFRDDDNFLPDSFEVSREEEGEDCPCGRELSRWDKAFVMLEDSQMRQNMLLQSVDGGLAGELRAVRSELGRLLARPPGACGRAPEKAKQWEPWHDGLLKRQQESTRQLREVLLSVLGLHRRLGTLEEKLEGPGPAAPEASSDGLCRALVEELRLTRDELRASRPGLPPARRSEMPTEAPPAGCPTALTFPAHPKGTQASVRPTLKRDLLAFTACVWAKPSHATEKAVLFSYCAGGNGTEFQLSLSQDAVAFSVGRTEHVEADALAGSFGKWTHYCGIWDGDSGKATLVVDGQAMGSQGQVAWAQVIPGGGAVQLGRESSACRLGGRVDDESTVFIGKLTGFNLWDVATTEAEVAPLLRSNGCNVKGNVVGWDVAQVTLGGGVLLH